MLTSQLAKDFWRSALIGGVLVFVVGPSLWALPAAFGLMSVTLIGPPIVIYVVTRRYLKKHQRFGYLLGLVIVVLAFMINGAFFSLLFPDEGMLAVGLAIPLLGQAFLFGSPLAVVSHGWKKPNPLRSEVVPKQPPEA